MRHRKRGRRLGRSSSHRKAMLRNLASALFLTEREDADLYDNAPKVKGRIVTTLPKAKEVRPLVERCIRLACKAHLAAEEARQYEAPAERGTEAWAEWRRSEQWRNWSQARAPVVAARRRVVKLLGNKEAASILFDTLAERFVDRNGGYTRILKLAKPRLGDAGDRAILELVGVNDRVRARSERPAFADDEPTQTPAEQPAGAASEQPVEAASSGSSAPEGSSNE